MFLMCMWRMHNGGSDVFTLTSSTRQWDNNERGGGLVFVIISVGRSKSVVGGHTSRGVSPLLN